MEPLEVKAVWKSYGETKAVRGADLCVVAGEIQALVGENGAGKSTLLKIAAGHVAPDEGVVWVGGTPLSPPTPHEALRRGVALVAQHFTLVGPFTVLENIILGHEPARGGRIDFVRARRDVEKVVTELGMPIDLNARTDTLGVGARQRIEIVRALYRDARVLLLDEPTAVLARGEADALYALLRRLTRTGYAVVVTTHKLDEVLDHADVTTVMREGEVVATRRAGATLERDASRDQLTRAIMGGHAPPPVARERTATSVIALELKDVTLPGFRRPLSLTVHAGEVVGLAGIEGNGQRELALLLAELAEPGGGTVRIGSDGSGRAAVVHEDRQREGLVLSATVADNLTLGELDKFTRIGLVSITKLDAAASARHARAGIVPRSIHLPAAALSGGNQQKIVVARALASTAAPLLVFAHPTRGIDVGAAHPIHVAILDAARSGRGVLIISSDLAELRTLSDRIVVLAAGSIAGEFPPDADEVALGHAMLQGTAA